MAKDSAPRGAAQWVAYYLGFPGATLESVAQLFDARFPGMPSDIRQYALSQGNILFGQAQEANVGQSNLPIGHYFGYGPGDEQARIRVRFGRGTDPGDVRSWITEKAAFDPNTPLEDVLATLAERAREHIQEDKYGVEPLMFNVLTGEGVFQFLPGFAF